MGASTSHNCIGPHGLLQGFFFVIPFYLLSVLVHSANCVKNMYACIWTYGIQLWGTASTSNIEILERFQSKALHMIVDAPWYVTNTVIRTDLQTPTVKEEIRRYSSQCSARLSTHPNDLIVNIIELPDNRLLPAYQIRSVIVAGIDLASAVHMPNAK
jgi:hypothetical protein